MKRIGWLHVFAQIAYAARQYGHLDEPARSGGVVQSLFEHAFDEFAHAYRAVVRPRV